MKKLSVLEAKKELGNLVTEILGIILRIAIKAFIVYGMGVVFNATSYSLIGQIIIGLVAFAASQWIVKNVSEYIIDLIMKIQEVDSLSGKCGDVIDYIRSAKKYGIEEKR